MRARAGRAIRAAAITTHGKNEGCGCWIFMKEGNVGGAGGNRTKPRRWWDV